MSEHTPANFEPSHSHPEGPELRESLKNATLLRIPETRARICLQVAEYHRQLLTDHAQLLESISGKAVPLSLEVATAIYTILHFNFLPDPDQPSLTPYGLLAEHCRFFVRTNDGAFHPGELVTDASQALSTDHLPRFELAVLAQTPVRSTPLTVPIQEAYASNLGIHKESILRILLLAELLRSSFAADEDRNQVTELRYGTSYPGNIRVAASILKKPETALKTIQLYQARLATNPAARVVPSFFLLSADLLTNATQLPWTEQLLSTLAERTPHAEVGPEDTGGDRVAHELLELLEATQGTYLALTIASPTASIKLKLRPDTPNKQDELEQKITQLSHTLETVLQASGARQSTSPPSFTMPTEFWQKCVSVLAQYSLQHPKDVQVNLKQSELSGAQQRVQLSSRPTSAELFSIHLRDLSTISRR